MKRLLTFLLTISFIVPCFSQSKVDKNQPILKLLSPTQSNILFSNNITENNQFSCVTYEYIYNGGGIALGDINNDGLLDIYFTGNMVADKLYLNKGKMQFEDITDKAIGQQDNDWRTGVTMVDVNADGFLDIYICRAGPESMNNKKSNLLYINNGNLTFSEKSLEYGIADTSLSTQASFFDYDIDGDLDMYLVNIPYRNPIRFSGGVLPDTFNNNGFDCFYENQDGFFVNKTSDVGINTVAFGLGISVSDINADGFPDIYIANDFDNADYLYINSNKKFINEIQQRTKHLPRFSMGIDIADFNNDNLFDIINLDMAYTSHLRSKTNMENMSSEKFHNIVKRGDYYQYMFNTLQLNNGNAKFSDIGFLSGVAKTNWSWGTLFSDFDNDGFKDIVITNGYRRDITDRDFQNGLKETVLSKTKESTDKYLSDPKNPDFQKEVQSSFEKAFLEVTSTAPMNKEPNFLFRNKGDLTFENVTEAWGFNKAVNSNGVAYGDLDNDGDLDLVINNLDEVASVYENQSNKNKDNNYLQLKLKGTGKNTFAIGARVTIFMGEELQVLELFPTRGFQSSVDYKLHFGLGNKKLVDKVEIRWPDLKVTVLENVKSNQVLEVDYNKSQFTTAVPRRKLEPIFNDISNNLNIKYEHKENRYDDFIKEVLLPHQLSHLGPCISIGDINKDGLEDMVLGGAQNQPTSLYFQEADGSFKNTQTIDFYHDVKSEDVGSLLFDFDKDGDLDLYMASGGNDYHEGHGSLQDRLYINNGGKLTRSSGLLPTMHTSTMSVKAADFDADGDLDLFVGGRLVPGKYPKAPRSYLLKNEGGKFIDVTEKYCKELMYPGMVTGVEFGDVNSDGKLDLTLIGEWMPLVVYLNKGDRFEKLEHKIETESMWFSLHGVDLDKDGDLDFVGGNLGKNCKFKGTVEKPFNIYADDFDGNGTWDMMMSFYEGDKNYPVRGRDCSSQQMPSIVDSFPTFKAFAMAEITEICGPKIDTALHLTARGFYTSVFINDGKGNFTMKKLPNEAQFSPTLDIHSEDLNKDGNMDLILVGNMYDVEVETVRYDAGRGVILMGDGKGGFKSIPPTDSGFFAWDNVKAMEKIKIGNKEVFVLTVNNGKLLAFEKK